MMVVQSVIFDSKKFSISDAIAWLLARGFKAEKFDYSSNFEKSQDFSKTKKVDVGNKLRFRQTKPDKKKSYYTVGVDKGVQYVMMF